MDVGDKTYWWQLYEPYKLIIHLIYDDSSKISYQHLKSVTNISNSLSTLFVTYIRHQHHYEHDWHLKVVTNVIWGNISFKIVV